MAGNFFSEFKRASWPILSEAWDKFEKEKTMGNREAYDRLENAYIYGEHGPAMPTQDADAYRENILRKSLKGVGAADLIDRVVRQSETIRQMQDSVNKLRFSNADLQTRNDAQSSMINRLNKENDELYMRIAKRDIEIDELRRELDSNRSLIANIATTINDHGQRPTSTPNKTPWPTLGETYPTTKSFVATTDDRDEFDDKLRAAQALERKASERLLSDTMKWAAQKKMEGQKSLSDKIVDAGRGALERHREREREAARKRFADKWAQRKYDVNINTNPVPGMDPQMKREIEQFSDDLDEIEAFIKGRTPEDYRDQRAASPSDPVQTNRETTNRVGAASGTTEDFIRNATLRAGC